MLLPDISIHPEYLMPQSKEWQEQLARRTGKYEYPWNATPVGVSESTIFENELSSLINSNSIVLDVGCGHGAFTCQWAMKAKKVIGIDMTNGFIQTANKMKGSLQVEFVAGNTKDGFPFAEQYFDVIFTRRGPTNWYPIANHILKPEGYVIGLHPGDSNGEGEELPLLFPGLFKTQKGTPILDNLNERLLKSGLKSVQINRVCTKVRLPTPEDILNMRLFGQNDNIRKYVWDECQNKVKEIFEKNSTNDGIIISAFHYIVTARGNK
jgi:SAM-dependent methyltransferase